MTLKEATNYLGYAPGSKMEQLFEFCEVRVIRLPVVFGKKGSRAHVRLLRSEIEAIPMELHNQGRGRVSHGKYPIRIDESGYPED